MPVSACLWIFGALNAVEELTSRANRPFAEPLPKLAGHIGEQLRMKTTDGEELGAWFFAGEDSQPAVVLLHGNRGSRSSRLDELKFLLNAECSVLSVTLRAHGDSTGYRNDFGYSARHDVIAAVNQLKQRCPDRPLLVWGGSLGTAAAIFAAPAIENEVDGWLLECPYRDLTTTVQQRLTMRLPAPLAQLAWWNLRWAAEFKLPYWREISPLKAAAQFPKNSRVTVLTGERDLRATPLEAKEIATAIGPHTNVVVIPNADHMQLFQRDQEPYREWLKSQTQ